MTEALIVGVLAVAAMAFVAAPLRRPEQTTPVDPLIELEEKKAIALSAILDLESERDVGKLSSEDFEELRGVYEADALDAIRQLDDAGSNGADPLEKEIALVRERLSGARCPTCDSPRRPGSVCPRCGT